MLSSLSTEAVCERLKQTDGIDPNMLPQYTATIKKVTFLNTHHTLELFSLKVLIPFLFQANINGRVLLHCNLDELKKEMEMNFGDWQLFRGMVRHLQSMGKIFNPLPTKL